MAHAHVRLKNEFTKDEKYHNLMRCLCWGFTALWKVNVITVPGQAETYYPVNQSLASTPPVVTDNYRWAITAEITIVQNVQPSPNSWGIRKGR